VADLAKSAGGVKILLTIADISVLRCGEVKVLEQTPLPFKIVFALQRGCTSVLEKIMPHGTSRELEGTDTYIHTYIHTYTVSVLKTSSQY
jgi:hypothetical protein